MLMMVTWLWQRSSITTSCWQRRQRDLSDVSGVIISICKWHLLCHADLILTHCCSWCLMMKLPSALPQTTTWPAALCVNLLVLWLEDRLTRLLSRTKIDFPALNSTGYLMPFCETPWEEWLTLPLALFGNCVSVLWEYLQLDLSRVSNVKSIY